MTTPGISTSIIETLLDGLELDKEGNLSFLDELTTKLDGDEIIEVLQSEVGFTSSTDRKPIIATYGCGPCVALGGYDATNKIAFLVHFSNEGEVEESGKFIFDTVSTLAKEKVIKPIELHLRGGVKKQSEATIAAIRDLIKGREDIPMEIKSEEILQEDGWYGKSLSIDARTGTTSEYDPRDNSKARVIGGKEVAAAFMSAFLPKITVAYKPESGSKTTEK